MILEVTSHPLPVRLRGFPDTAVGETEDVLCLLWRTRVGAVAGERTIAGERAVFLACDVLSRTAAKCEEFSSEKRNPRNVTVQQRMYEGVVYVGGTRGCGREGASDRCCTGCFAECLSMQRGWSQGLEMVTIRTGRA